MTMSATPSVTPPRTSRELDMALISARQTISILRSQAQAGRIEASYLDQRLQALEQVLEGLAEERKRSGQQERLAKLYEVSRAIGSSLDLQTVLNQVMDAIIQLTGAERGYLMLQDDDGNLGIRVARNFDQETIDPAAVAVSRTVTRRVMESGQPVVTTNAQEDPRFAGQQSIIAHALRSIMATPLRVRGAVIGVVYVDSRVHTGLFSEHDLDVLDAFAGQAAVTIDNARLFSATDQALSRRVEELTMLQRMDRQLNETLDLHKALNLTLEWSARACSAQSASIGLLDHDGRTLRLVSHFGAPDEFTQTDALDLNHPLVRQAIEAQEPTLHTLQDMPQASDGAGAGAAPRKVLIVPVRREGKTIAIIALTSIDENAFRPDDRALVSRIADRAAIAIENARLYDAVKAANNAKSEFVGLVAHELKVPMTSISGYADLLSMAGPVSERQAGFINTIKNAVNRMKVLVSDLNDISRIETGQLHVELVEVSVIEAIQNAREGASAEIERRGHKLLIEVEPDLPQVKADPNRLSQVMLNLLSNACKYTPDGGQISIGARHDGSRVTIWVRDNGVGMTAEQVAKLGTKFWRAENGLQQPGTGLGFAITRHLIDLMHGTLSIQSAPGQGTTVEFTLPVMR